MISGHGAACVGHAGGPLEHEACCGKSTLKCSSDACTSCGAPKKASPAPQQQAAAHKDVFESTPGPNFDALNLRLSSAF